MDSYGKIGGFKIVLRYGKISSTEIFVGRIKPCLENVSI